jgi:hypothetical protein
MELGFHFDSSIRPNKSQLNSDQAGKYTCFILLRRENTCHGVENNNNNIMVVLLCAIVGW